MTDDELKLIGLQAVAKHHIDALKDIEMAAMKITGDPQEGGHTSDWIWCEFAGSASDLLDRVGEVIKAKMSK